MPTPPLDLLAGYPQRYKPKDETVLSPVDTIVSAALQANAGMPQVDVITYRNNLNKLLLTPLEMNNEWAINACYMQVGCSCQNIPPSTPVLCSAVFSLPQGV
jgi:hypothetical protein